MTDPGHEGGAHADALPVFGFLSRHREPMADGVAQETHWMARAAASGRAAAHLWQGVQGLVVPRSYERAPRWREACAASADAGWPVQVRGSGGGLVPQGPGVLNLSLAWPLRAGQQADIDRVYRGLCTALGAGLAELGIATQAAAVEGSFCDGRYNLAAGPAKLVGTAQCWRRVGESKVVLAHAVMLVEADPAALTARGNAFEAAAGHERRYRPEAVTSVARAWRAAHAGAEPPQDLPDQLALALARHFARVLPPNVRAA